MVSSCDGGMGEGAFEAFRPKSQGEAPHQAGAAWEPGWSRAGEQEGGQEGTGLHLSRKNTAPSYTCPRLWTLHSP